MRLLHNTKLVCNAKTLCKAMTKEGRHLWYDFLKNLPQHYELEHRQKDIERDSFLNNCGIVVLRYSNDDIHNRFDAV